MKTTHILIILCLLTILASCGEDKIVYPEGGYEYPKHYTDKDTTFYTYPLKQFYSRKDSFRASQDFFYYRYLHEPNLSIKPLGKDYFRLEYSGVYSHPYYITVTESKIIIKQPCEEYNWFIFNLYHDKYDHFETPEEEKAFLKYTKSDKYLLTLIQEKFPFGIEGKYSISNHRFDSLLKVHPRLRDAGYCWQLINNKMLPTSKLKYDSTIIPITKRDFRHIISVINNSGYWKMPYRIKCSSPPTDGWGFFLEANTSKRYNYVEYQSCEDENKMQKDFCRACQEIIKYAKLDKKIKIFFPNGNGIDTVKVDSATIQP